MKISRTTFSLGFIPIVAAIAMMSTSREPSRAAASIAAADTVSGGDVVLGRKVFEGKAGGALCVTCHGAQAKGVAGIGPDLTDKTWLHGDGSAEFLRKIISAGVMKPKKTAAVMPPNGGGSLSAAQVDAVAAYITSLQK